METKAVQINSLYHKGSWSLWYVRLMCPCGLALPTRMQEWQQGDHRASNQVSGGAKIQVGSQLGVPRAKGLVWEGEVDGGDPGLWGYSMGGAYNPVTRVQEAPKLRFPHGLGSPLSLSGCSCSLKSTLNKRLCSRLECRVQTSSTV